jgi:hypothetical protein
VRCPGKQLNPPKVAERSGFGREDKSSFVLIQDFLWRAGMDGTSGPFAGRFALVIRQTSNDETMNTFKGIFIVSADYLEARSITAPWCGNTTEYSAPSGGRSLCVHRSEGGRYQKSTNIGFSA